MSLTAIDRLRRLLAILPWLSGQGSVPLHEIADRFDYPLDRLRKDLMVVQCVGVYPYTPDMLVEVDLDEDAGRVEVVQADWFSSPLRLTPEEGLLLLSAGLALKGAGSGDDDALERGLEKIAAKFGLTLGDELQVSLGGVEPALLSSLRDSVDARRCLRVEYHSLHRGETTTRVLEPHHVFSAEGEWYLRAHCRLVDEERTFRLDRMLDVETLDETFDFDGDRSDVLFAPDEDDLRVTLRLAPDAAWVAESHPMESVTADGDVTVVTMAISSLPWLERLLLQLGRHAEIVDAVPALPDRFRARSAERILARYQE